MHPCAKASHAVGFHRVARLRSATRQPFLLGYFVCVGFRPTQSSGSRLPAAISACASLDSPIHSGSASHASAMLMPGSSFSLARACPAFSDRPINNRAQFMLPRSAFSSSVGTILPRSCLTSSSTVVSTRGIPSPAVPCVAFCSFGSAAFVSFVRTISPPIPDFCSAALRRSIVADFEGSLAHYLFPCAHSKSLIRQDPFQDLTFHARFRGK